MPLDPVTLAQNLTSAEISATPGPVNSVAKSIIDAKNTAIALAIHEYLLKASFLLTVSPGIPVSTAGSAVAQTGATTGTGTGSVVIS